jgi:GNAT superfamily N-acetyltransferase
MDIRVKRFSPDNEADFFDFHTRVGGECFCTAWWVPSWEAWDEATAESNRQLRTELLARDEFDGYLLYLDGAVVGWCQVGARDRLSKLVTQFGLEAEDEVWAISCFQINPQFRGWGLATRLLAAVLADLRERGIGRVQAYPKLDARLPADQQWTGPRALYEQAGFQMVRENKSRAILEIAL